MKVILISGKSGHGKDTMAGMLKEMMEADGKSVLTIHYADLLKFICRQYFGWNGEKDDYGRSLLQRVGTDVIRAKDNDFWVRFVASFLELFPDEWDYVLIPDTRFPNEISAIKRRFDATHLKMVREDYDSPLSPEQQNHPSETALDGVIPDCTISIRSGGLDIMREAAKKFYQIVEHPVQLVQSL